MSFSRLPVSSSESALGRQSGHQLQGPGVPKASSAFWRKSGNRVSRENIERLGGIPLASNIVPGTFNDISTYSSRAHSRSRYPESLWETKLMKSRQKQKADQVHQLLSGKGKRTYTISGGWHDYLCFRSDSGTQGHLRFYLLHIPCFLLPFWYTTFTSHVSDSVAACRVMSQSRRAAAMATSASYFLSIYLSGHSILFS